MRIGILLILAVLLNDPKEIAKINTLKKEAETAYLNGDYELALAKYTLLRDSLGVDDAALKLNLAHSHYHLGDTAGAKSNYNQLATSPDKKLKSIAYQQLGVMNKDAGKLEEALQQLKSAIKADPTNQDARYNYEVVKKLLEEQKEQQQQNQDQQNQDQENKDGEDENQDQKQDQKQDGEQENKEEQKGENQEQSEEDKQQQEQQNQNEQQEGEEQEQEKSQEQMTKEKLEEMGISEEKARQLLEAMRQSEIKYLQHQKRKATKRPPSGKPDW
ncbi:hypothetical protein [Ekhidna sp.]|uniref:hypothetical protein n=1 Tax=Ekhidna sp. TaxID=2608089 RepID=UPI003CCBF0DF